ncbi:MAG: DUF349 domain-containing protein [Bacteroidales bacterium]
MEKKDQLNPVEEAEKKAKAGEEISDPLKDNGENKKETKAKKAESSTADEKNVNDSSTPEKEVADDVKIKTDNSDASEEKPEKEKTEVKKKTAEKKATAKASAKEKTEESEKDEAEAEEKASKAKKAVEKSAKPDDSDKAKEKKAPAKASTKQKTEEPVKDDAEEKASKTENAGEKTAKPDDSDKTKEKQKQDAKVSSGKEQVESEEEDIAAKYENLSKEELVEAIEALVQHEDVNHIRKYIGAIRVNFRKHLKEEGLSEYEKQVDADNKKDESGEKQEEKQDEKPVDPLNERFDKAFALYKEKKAAFDQAFEKQKNENLKEKEQILEELRKLIDSEEELKKTYDQFRELQERWKQIGPVPQNAKNTLWNNFNFLVEKFFDKVKINKELKDLDLKKNLEAKTELCEKAEALLLETSISKSFQQLQKLHEAWKETGPVQKDKKDDLWERFKAATDQLNKRRQEFYEGVKEEQQKNYAAKVVLCEKAEQLTEEQPKTPREWQHKTDQINELFKVWKTIGFAPKKQNNEIWNRFRSAMDKIFQDKKAFFKQYKDIQSENYNEKINLCIQAEAIKDSEDWKQATDQLIGLQQEWKKIGPVPSKYSEKIWKRFREACDHFFNRKSEYFANIGEKQDENLKKKLSLIEEVKNHNYTDDNKTNLKVLNDFQREWMNIGHVPIKQKDKVQKEFRNAINEQFERLKISQKAQKTFSFKNKIENLKANPNADNIIHKERNFLIGKINHLNNDIKLWENNIGFFASSKKADVLKAEFEQKIEKAKEEIRVIEAKLKIIENQ